MNHKKSPRRLSRRNFLKLSTQSAMLAALGGGGALYGLMKSPVSQAAIWPGAAPEPVMLPPQRPKAASTYRRLAATDGFLSLPGRRIGAHYDDPLPDDQNGVYVFGFIEVPVNDPPPEPPPGSTQEIGEAILNLKGRVQGPSPILAVNEDDQLNLTLTNLGFEMRPDLDDSHTIHWHGFRNPNAVFDGVPEVSISVPPARDFTYFYLPRDPGTYMYHCHFEDTEHVQMGMDGIVFVRPAGFTNRAYPDASTEFSREYTLLLNEMDTSPRDQLLNVQEFVWSDYDPNYWLINSRSYPDTILSDSDIVGTELEKRQPVSSLIQAKEGDRILLRFANLGYEQQAMQLLGIRMRVIGIDAGFLGPLAYDTNTIYIGPGEARDVLFTAPPFDPATALTDGDAGDYNVYWLKNHNYQRLVNGAGDRVGDPGSLGAVSNPQAIDGSPAEIGGQITQVRVYASSNTVIGTQTRANQTFPDPSLSG